MNKENKEVDTSKYTVITKKKKIWIAITMAIVIVISFFCGFFTYRISCGKNTKSINWALNMIESHGCYYDEKSGEIKEFSEEDYLKMIMANLDRYSAFYTKQEYSSEVATSKGNNYGIGVSFMNYINSYEYTAYRVIWNSPAEKAGVKEGDIFKGVVKNNGKILFSSSYTIGDAINEAKENKEINFIVNRNDNEINIIIKKQVYIANYIKYFDNEKSLVFSSDDGKSLTKTITDNGLSELDDKTAYVSLFLFEGNAKNGIKEAMNYLRERGKTKIILDLRNNGGGFMDTLEEISSYFVKSSESNNPVIAIAKDKDGNKELFKSLSTKYNNSIEKIIVLANENTASASECLIGAMLYYGSISKDTLIIEKHKNSENEMVATTYGKGIMQTTYKNIFSGEAIKLTTATVFWPDGTTTIHNKGLTTTESNSVDKGSALSRALEII